MARFGSQALRGKLYSGLSGVTNVAFATVKTRIEVAVLSLLGVVLIGFLDDWTGYEISVSIFYLVPVLAAAWRAGWWPSVLVSFAAAVMWSWSDAQAGYAFGHPAIPVWNAFVRLCFFLTNGYLASQLRSHLEHERRLARQDTLTGVLNGRAFFEETERYMSLARRKGQPFTVVYIDLDNFKQVNDARGHREGDQVLCVVADALEGHARRSDLVARLGGDEFGVMLPEADYEEAAGYVAKARSLLQAGMDRNRWPVTFSIGVVTFREPPVSVDLALNAADELMYRVKRSGKSGVLHEVRPGPAPGDGA